MAYGIIRALNIHMGELNRADNHNGRNFGENGEKRPVNISEVSRHPEAFDKTHFHHVKGKVPLLEAVSNRLKEKNVKTRKNSIVAIEYVLTMSPDAMESIKKSDPEKVGSFLQYAKNFVAERHGEENIVSSSYHFDESNPHVHVIATPIEKKEIAFKNRYGEGRKEKNVLAARDFTGSKQALRDLQTDYFNYLNQKKDSLKKYGVEIKRGVDARDRRARGEFYDKFTNHLIAEPMQEIREAKKAVELGIITKEEGKQLIDASERKIKGIAGGIDRKKQKDAQRYREGAEWIKTTRSMDVGKKTPKPKKEGGLNM